MGPGIAVVDVVCARVDNNVGANVEVLPAVCVAIVIFWNFLPVHQLPLRQSRVLHFWLNNGDRIVFQVVVDLRSGERILRPIQSAVEHHTLTKRTRKYS